MQAQLEAKWSSRHLTFNNFQIKQYMTVQKLILKLSDDIYNTLDDPPPPPAPVKKSPKKKPKKKEIQPTLPRVIGTITVQKASTVHCKPTNYCTMLCLEGTVENNLKSEALQSYCNSIDRSLYPVSMATCVQEN